MIWVALAGFVACFLCANYNKPVLGAVLFGLVLCLLALMLFTGVFV